MTAGIIYCVSENPAGLSSWTWASLLTRIEIELKKNMYPLADALTHVSLPTTRYCPCEDWHFMWLTHSAKQWSQQTDQRLAAQITKDFYDCPLCGKLFDQCHSTHKHHLCFVLFQHLLGVRLMLLSLWRVSSHKAVKVSLRVSRVSYFSG